MKRVFATIVLAATVFVSGATTSLANRLVAHVDISSQTMTVKKDGRVLYNWKVSTARPGYRTPTGQWKPTRMHEMWHSRKYDMSPMPYSIFFYGGYAIHGTNSVSKLGRPASHGCIRLRTENARKLYNLTRKIGPRNMKVVITN
ncbi:L,D-transpeptidase [Oricola thermophila]|uniref:L,D-transpeptidase n=1 Tax=Oricola thermophila TaxID=2742145 RepID=A0A6N1V9L4_9HYPH|nr:L,D-transpeptidase [Oricola thermophila]QKV17418.1 L,D-transpeptidase [Oricola thermophila]